MADRWVCRSCWAANEDRWDKCFRCGVTRGTQPAGPLAASASTAQPSRSALDAEIDGGCLPSFETYVGRDYETSELYVTTFEPTPEGWEVGDRGLLCVISTFDADTPLTGSVRDSGR